MPTTLGPKYPTDWYGRPPHMLGEDVPVWHRFLAEYGEFFTGIYYDVLLGGPILTQEEEKDPIKRAERAYLSKRADAIAEREKEVWLIEVDKHPGMRALGQLMTYRHLWIEDTPIEKPEILVLVAGVVDTDIVSAAARYMIQVYIFPDRKTTT